MVAPHIFSLKGGEREIDRTVLGLLNIQESSHDTAKKLIQLCCFESTVFRMEIDEIFIYGVDTVEPVEKFSFLWRNYIDPSNYPKT